MSSVTERSALLNAHTHSQLAYSTNSVVGREEDADEYLEITDTASNTPLNRYIIDHVIQDTPIPETTCLKATRVVVRGLAIAVGMAGNLTYANLAGEPARCEDSEEFNEPYRWTLITSNAIAFGVLTTWALLILVNQAVRARSESEKQIPKPEINKCAQVAAKTSAIAGGIISQAASAFVAYKYNNNSIPLAILIVVSNASYPIHSLDLTFQAALKQRTFSPFEKKLHIAQITLLQSLQRRKNEFLSMSPEQKGQFIACIHALETNTELNDSQRLKQYLELLLRTDAAASPESRHILIKGARTIAGVGGLFLSAMLLSHHWMGAYLGTEEFTNLMSEEADDRYGEAIRQTAAAFVTGCNAYLTVGTVVKSVVSIFDDSTQLLQGQLKIPLSVQLRPKTATVLKILAVGFAGTCWGASVQFSRNYFPEPFEKVVEIGASIANAALVNFVMQSSIDDGIIAYTGSHGEGQEHDIAKVARGMDDVISKIEQSSMRNFAYAIRTWSELLGDALPLDVSPDELNRYLSKQEEIIPLSATA